MKKLVLMALITSFTVMTCFATEGDAPDSDQGLCKTDGVAVQGEGAAADGEDATGASAAGK